MQIIHSNADAKSAVRAALGETVNENEDEGPEVRGSRVAEFRATDWPDTCVLMRWGVGLRVEGAQEN